MNLFPGRGAAPGPGSASTASGSGHGSQPQRVREDGRDRLARRRAGGLLSACGISTPPTASSASKVTGPPRRGGTLRAAITGGSSADTLDPLAAITNADFSRVDNLFEPLVGLTPGAQAQLVLAEEVTPNAAATEWTVRLKPGITFHNGKDLTADDVMFTFRDDPEPEGPGGRSGRPDPRSTRRA